MLIPIIGGFWHGTQVFEKINNIYVPSNAKSLALKDKEVIKKVTEVEAHKFNLSGGDSLEVFRSNPAIQDDNTNCLVSLYTSARYKQHALFSGDYVYRDMNNDKNPKIKSLVTKHYAAIIVPHHGDLASSISVFKPSVPDTSIAFFQRATINTINIQRYNLLMHT